MFVIKVCFTALFLLDSLWDWQNCNLIFNIKFPLIIYLIKLY